MSIPGKSGRGRKKKPNYNYTALSFEDQTNFNVSLSPGNSEFKTTVKENF